jgi:glycerophosphoryl diester phosphodiesterase
VTCARTVRHFHARGMKVFVWTVDDEAEMRSLVGAGVDGIMTDRPDVLARVLRGG